MIDYFDSHRIDKPFLEVEHVFLEVILQELKHKGDLLGGRNILN